MNPLRILVIGAGGQLGSELLPELAARYGEENVIATDVKTVPTNLPVEVLDVLDAPRLRELMAHYQTGVVYHLAAMLSAAGEQAPHRAWEVNMQGLIHVLDASVDLGVKQVFWPSSIAVFGPTTPRDPAPQVCPMEPTTMYGITKQAGERLCEYYWRTRGLDVRSLRFPGLISYNALPGGGTTDYAVHMFYEALRHRPYTCYLQPDAMLPMMYMPDALKAVRQLMDAPAEQVRVRSSYNLGAISFTPAELTQALQAEVPDFSASYAPDFRQAIAASWPMRIDDSAARQDWGWQPQYDLTTMVRHMLQQLSAFQYEQG